MNEQNSIDKKKQHKFSLPNFEGPLALLLDLIRSSQINIYDIPVADITAQYLEYLNLMKQIDMEKYPHEKLHPYSQKLT